MVQPSHPYMTTGRTTALTIWTFVCKVMSLLFNTVFRFVIAFLPRSKCLNSVAIVTIWSDFGDLENNICHCCDSFPIYLLWSDGTRCHDFSCWMLSFKPAFSPSSRGFTVRSHLLPLEWYYLHIWGGWYFSWHSWFQLVLHPAQHSAWRTLHIS